MDNWDRDEKKRKNRQEQQQIIGKYLFVGASIILVVYLATVFLEIYFG